MVHKVLICLSCSDVPNLVVSAKAMLCASCFVLTFLPFLSFF